MPARADVGPMPRSEPAARDLVLSGRVQAVGFRPFVWRAAQQFGLAGWVRNGVGRVEIHVEGDDAAIDGFTAALTNAAPKLARPVLQHCVATTASGMSGFRILSSAATDSADIHLPPDLFCCDDCLAELRAPDARRHRYAFTNCTQCGPRYSIIAALPYDRAATAMADFSLCPHCRGEYENPADRRFHAEPLGCPSCGPQLEFSDIATSVRGDAALDACVAALRAGAIMAVKGIGGFHLLCDATDDAAVRRLRARKHRPDKPLAVMFPQRGADGLDAIRACAELDEIQASSLIDPARPIVVVPWRAGYPLSPQVAPGLNEIGAFLPYSPLHHLLLAELNRPLVATSGNLSGEPVLTANDEAMFRLSTVADAFLTHDRAILRPADDSVVRVIAGRARPIRLGRGVAPLEIECSTIEFSRPTLAVGGHDKVTVALGWGRRAVVSPHIGDLSSPRGRAVFAQVITDLCALYQLRPEQVLCDLHPGYGSTNWARAQPLPVRRVQHHAAHASALAGERPEVARWLIFAWDGVGLGDDGTLWGGEALIGTPGAWRRAASLRQFRLGGGDAAARQPWRSAAALMWEAGLQWTPPRTLLGAADAALVESAWRHDIAQVRSSAAGRVFDAAAALTLGLGEASFEGHGPMLLEALAGGHEHRDGVELPLARDARGIWRTDWAPLLPLLADAGRPAEWRAALLHESLARAIAAQAEMLGRQDGFDAVGLTGGVFQNRVLSERVSRLLTEAGMCVHLPSLLPGNDGGLAFGQLIEAGAAK